MYSMPRDLMTSTMKSEPERFSVSTSSFAGVPISASGGIGVGRALRVSNCCACAALGFAARTAAPTAAPLRNARRSSEAFLGEPFLDLRMMAPPGQPFRRLYHTRANAGRGAVGWLGFHSMGRSCGKDREGKAQSRLRGGGESHVKKTPAPYPAAIDWRLLFLHHVHIFFAAVHLRFGLLLATLLCLGAASASAGLTGGTIGRSFCCGLFR